MSKELYSKKEVIELFKKLLERYGDLEVKFYWRNPYVGGCESKIDIREEDGKYKVTFYSAVC